MQLKIIFDSFLDQFIKLPTFSNLIAPLINMWVFMLAIIRNFEHFKSEMQRSHIYLVYLFDIHCIQGIKEEKQLTQAIHLKLSSH